MGEATIDSTDKPVGAAKKNQQKKKSLRILFGHAEISFLLPGGLDLRRHWVFQLCFSRVFFFPAFSSNLLQFLRRVALVITQ